MINPLQEHAPSETGALNLNENALVSKGDAPPCKTVHVNERGNANVNEMAANVNENEHALVNLFEGRIGLP